MELKGKTFDINGNKKKVVNTDSDFAYFADGARVKTDILLTKYEEVMDADSFFNNENGLQNLANDFEKIDTKTITEHHAPTTNVNNTGAPETVTIINGEEEQQQPVTEQPAVQQIDNSGLNAAPSPGMDLFSKMKRNNSIDIDFKITEKFPDLDFIRMMNDNYEDSIIEHLAREIVEQMIYDPEALLGSITERITEIVYGKDSVQLKEIKQDSPYSKELEPINENAETIEKITEDRKFVAVGDEDKVEVIEENLQELTDQAQELEMGYGDDKKEEPSLEMGCDGKEEIATNVNEKIENKDEQETNKETGITDTKSESEPQQEV